MKINVKECAAVLMQQDDILILTHAHPDGDTLGCGFALCRALLALGKRARVINADEIPAKYDYLFEGIEAVDFEPKFIVAVDVATENLLGELNEIYGGKINLCIDHHGTNTLFAEKTLLEEVAAACETMFKLIKELGVQIDKSIAACLYTGITTDTGCFRYASVTAETFRAAAELVELGADNGAINRAMFETKTKTYAKLERLAINSMRFYCNDRVAVITVTQDMYAKTGSNETETEALAPLTRQIEGVEIGLTIREKSDKTCKVSIRTFENVNAAELAKYFGGGGHPQASACRFDCSVDEATKQLIDKCAQLLGDK